MKQVLITGGTGSFGQALVRKLLKLPEPPDRIAIFSRSEHLQEAMERKFDNQRLRFFIGDVRDQRRLELALHGIDTVFHAAALKIVPIAEYNPTEAIATNITGAENLVRATIRTGVQKVIAISTDKAVNPVNLYGATKLCAEKIFMAANVLAAGSCRYSICRYGNVSNSRGSVVPLFKALAAEGKPFTVTDQRMTRFWISLEQAVDFVLSSLNMMQGREIFIPKIPSVSVMALAAAIDPNNRMKVSGIRPGEKLHEVLLTEDEARNTAELGDRYIIGRKGNLPEGFRYASNSNTDWLRAEQLKRML